MVRQNVYKHTYTVFSCFIKHRLHLIFRPYDIVADCPVDRLIVMIPVSFLLIQNLHVPSVGTETCIYRRGLDHGKSGISNLLHVFSNGREVPAPDMEDSFGIGKIRVMGHAVYSPDFSLRCASHKCKACEKRNDSVHISDIYDFRYYKSNLANIGNL